METLVLFDYNNLLHKGISVHTALKKGPWSTGGLFGFISQIAQYVNSFKPTKIGVCLDSPPYHRTKLYPTYKEKRPSKDNIILKKISNENREYINQLLEEMNLVVWQVPGYEADDLMAKACEVYHNKVDRIIIASNDSDLHQVLKHDNIFLCKKKDHLYSIENFKKAFPFLKIEDWVDYLSVIGTHNAIPGIVGVGPVTTIKLFENGNFQEFYEAHKEEIDLYRKIIKLPFDNKLSVPKEIPTKFTYRRVSAYLHSFGIVVKPYMLSAIEHMGGVVGLTK